MKKENTSDKLSLSLCLCVSIFVSFTLFIFGPLELYISNQHELWFSLTDIILCVIIVSLIVFSIIFFPCKFLNKKVAQYILAGFYALGLAAYLQGNYININYGQLNGNEIIWSEYGAYAVVNTLIWLVIFCLPFVIVRFVSKYSERIFKYTSLLIIGMQLVALIVLGITTPEKSGRDSILTSNNELEVSSNENIIVFVVDTMDAQWFEEVIKRSPEISDSLDGFTYFNDMAAGGAPTVFGLPSLLTGEEYAYLYDQENYELYKEKAYSDNPLFKELYENNYDIAWYTENEYLSPVINDYLSNYTKAESKPTSTIALTAKLYQFVGYKYSPHILKKGFWFYSGDFNKFKDNSKTNQYIIDDVALYNRFISNEMKLIEDKNVFRLFHMTGSHGPYTMNENCESVDSSQTGIYQQTQGALKIIFTYIDMLKKNDVYDNTNIIITADHGGLNCYQNPAFLVKPAHSNGEMSVSSAQVAFSDIPPTIASFFLEDYESFGKTVFEIKEGEQRIRYFYSHADLVYQYCGTSHTSNVVKFEIVGPSRDNANLIEVAEMTDTLKQVEDYELGTSIVFKSSGNSETYTFSGFSGQENEYTWSSGYESKMKLYISDPEQYEGLILNIDYAKVMNNNTEMIISTANGIIYDDVISGSGTISVPLTSEDFENGTLTLLFEWPDAISPQELYGAQDRRKLAVAFSKMSIESGIYSSDSSITKREYIVGESIDFSVGGNSEQYILSGFSGQEDEFTWSDGYKGEMKLLVSDPEQYEGLVFNIDYDRVIKDATAMTISTANGIIYDDVVSGSGTISVPLTSDDFENGMLTLLFEWPDAVSPQELYGTQDSRKLAVAFSKMSIDINAQA